MTRSLRRRGLVLTVLAVLASGCGGPGESGQGEPERERAARTLIRFLEAAGSSDAASMWHELSTATQRRLGPAVDDFGNGVAIELAEGLGSFAGAGYDVVVDEQVGEGVAVAAIEGDRVVEGAREHAAYAVALVDEDGAWKLVLGAPAVVPIEPPPGEVVDAGGRARVRVEGTGSQLGDALLWLDGVPVGGVVHGAGAVVAPLADTGPGRHVLVAYAEVGGVPGAAAWTFTVR